MLIGHMDAKKSVDRTPYRFLHYFKKEEVTQLQKELKNAGADSEIIPVNPAFKPLQEISTSAFFDQYIRAFIQNISSYEA